MYFNDQFTSYLDTFRPAVIRCTIIVWSNTLIKQSATLKFSRGKVVYKSTIRGTFKGVS